MPDELFFRLRHFLRELKRRKVYHVAITYLVVAAGAVQLVSVVVPASRLPTWSDEFFLALAVFGFPLAVVLAWAFEVTPEGVRRTETAEERPAAPGALRWVGLALVVFGAGGAWFLLGSDQVISPGDGAAVDTTSSGAEIGSRSIAVLPFDNLSGSERAVPFVNGIHDDLLVRLSNISGMKVISRTSVGQYRTTDKTTAEIARELGVKWILEGGVQEMSDQIQVNVQLIDPRTDTHAWAESYRRNLTAADLFAVQSEITMRIARSLEAELSPQERARVERRPTEDLGAYRLYAAGREELETRSEAGIRAAVEYFERAIAEDSTYALAWSGLSDARSLLAEYGHAGADSMHPLAEEAARRAVRLDSGLAEAHVSLARAHVVRNEAGPAIRHLQRAVELKPNYARAYHWLGNLYAQLGYPEPNLRYLRRAAELDPRSPPIQSSLARVYWFTEGPGEQALRHARRAIELEPDYPGGHLVLGLIYSDAGRYEEAESALLQALELTQEGSRYWSRVVGALGITYARSGDTPRARAEMDRLKGGEDASIHVAMVQITLGNEAAAFEALADLEWGGIQAWLLRTRPAFDPIRAAPRFEQLMRDANRAWGLRPDGTLPESVNVSLGSDSTR